MPELNGFRKTDSGALAWYLNNEFHREDGPALITADGDVFWYKHGAFHREDGAAVIYANGTRKCFVNGELHRIDGPAIIWNDNSIEWFIRNERIKDNNQFQVLSGLSDEAMTALVLMYGDIK